MIRRLLTWARWIAGLWAFYLAGRWLVQALVSRELEAATGYPNEWGVRTIPLSPAEAARARVLERATLAGDLDNASTLSGSATREATATGAPA
jgi:hypothetical protein